MRFYLDFWGLSCAKVSILSLQATQMPWQVQKQEERGGYTVPVASWGEEMAVNKNISIWPKEATTLASKLTAGKSRVDSGV